jgi:AcrR family transcriptional regulator
MPRRYVQRARAEAALQTRRQVIDAARAALLADGRLELAVGDVAEAAGVARSTVYAAFGSRAGLLAALSDDTLHRAGLGDVIAAYRLPDAVEAVERSLAASSHMYAAGHRVFSRMMALAQVDPEAAAPIARSQRDRGAGMADLAARLAAQGRLRPGVSPERAADVLWLLTGFAAFDELHAGRNLNARACADVLVGIARAAVIAPG